jgi:hypothetical protein
MKDPYHYTKKANREIAKTRKEVDKIELRILEIEYKMRKIFL